MEAFAKSIVDTVRYPLLILDETHTVVAANGLFCRMFAVTQLDLANRPLADRFSFWNFPRLRSLLDLVLSGGTPLDNFETDADVPGLGHRILALHARRIRSDQGGAFLILISIEDVTEQRQAQTALRQLNTSLESLVAERTADLEKANRELREANRELAATNQELEAFCYSVSHDLRAPLRAVDGFSQELLSTYAERLDAQGLHYLKRIRAGTQRMGQLIDDLLKLSRVTRVEMCREVTDLTALAEAVALELRQSYANPSRTPVEFVAAPGLTAFADPHLMQVVLENLLGNAWKFTQKTESAKVEFGRCEHEGRPGFFVRDNGAGFDPAYQKMLFGAFQRLHSDREFPGTGVGLATVQRIIRRHGGQTWATGAVNQGATFYFTLPNMENRA